MKKLFRLSLGERGVRRDVSSEIDFHIEMRTRELVDAHAGTSGANMFASARGVRSSTPWCTTFDSPFARWGVRPDSPRQFC
jgi:hypothetical protein